MRVLDMALYKLMARLYMENPFIAIAWHLLELFDI